MKLHISVIICTHNPREDYLQRVFLSLVQQSMPKCDWELLLIDNLSKELLSQKWDLSWHPNARHIREDVLGLTAARLKGISEASGEILLFVDDDNVLPSDFLKLAFKISHEYPFLGAWGGGCEGEFEGPVPDWIEPFLPNLAIFKIYRPSWTNQYFDYRCTPVGAGLCIRKFVAEKYIETLKKRCSTEHLDRRGEELVSCGDHDLAFCSIDLGMGIGLFPELNPIHLIPEKRMKKDYVLKLIEADAYSTYILKKMRNFEVEKIQDDDRNSVIKKTKLQHFKQTTWDYIYSLKNILKMDSKNQLQTQKTFLELVHDARVRGIKKAALKYSAK